MPVERHSQGTSPIVGQLTRPINSGVWSEGSGSLGLVAREGATATGTDTTFSFFHGLVLNDAGQTAFVEGLITNLRHGDFKHVWSESEGSLELISGVGNRATGTTRDFLEISSRPSFNNSGQVAFRAILAGEGVNGNDSVGIWSEGSGSLTLVALEGNEAIGTTAFFSSLSTPAMNNVGQTAFLGGLTDSGANTNEGSGIWSEGNGSLAMIAREGSRAPGTVADFRGFFTIPVLNNAGQIAFWGGLTGLGVDKSNDRGIWSERDGSLTLVVREGSRAPGTIAEFSSLSSNPVLNNKGDTAFRGGLTGLGVNNDNSSGIWSERNGSLGLVARSGEMAVGTNLLFHGFGSPSLNGEGQTAFVGFLSGPGVDDGNDSGIWAQSISGGLRLIALEGDQLDVDDGPGTDFRTIRSLRVLLNSGNGDGRPSGFNDLGQVAFHAEFTDGSSGVFVSNLAAVPEPSSLLLLGVIGLGLLSGGRGPRGGCRCRGARPGGR